MRAEGANDCETSRKRGHEVGLFGGVVRGETKEGLIHDRAFGYHFQPTREDYPANLQTLTVELGAD
jgi:hypothetical protein